MACGRVLQMTYASYTWWTFPTAEGVGTVDPMPGGDIICAIR